MSRTNRKNITDKNYREARKGRGRREMDWTRKLARGGLQMHPSNAGEWFDELQRSPLARKAQKRRQRRRDERTALADALNN